MLNENQSQQVAKAHRQKLGVVNVTGPLAIWGSEFQDSHRKNASKWYERNTGFHVVYD